MDDWKPVGYGNPMSNDPTLVYVPPVLDPVHYGIHTLEPMWPIRGSNRLQTSNHNGKIRPTLLTPPEGAGHFQNALGTGETTRVGTYGGNNKIPSLLPPSSSITSARKSFVRNRYDDSSQATTIRSTYPQLANKQIAPCCAEDQETIARPRSHTSSGPYRDIDRSITRDIDSEQRSIQRRPHFQFVQQVRSRVRLYGSHSG